MLASAFRPLKDAAFDLAHDKALVTLIAASASMPWWQTKLHAMSEFVGFGAQMLTLMLAIWKLWQFAHQSGHEKGLAAARDGASEMAKTAKEAAKLSPRAAGGVAAVAALTVGAMLLSRRKGTSAPEPLGLVSGARKLSDDRAGDEGEVAGDAADCEPWHQWYVDRLGLHERLKNGKGNPAVAEFFEHVGLAGYDPRTTPWCAAALNAALIESGYDGTKSAMARSFLHWGAECEPKRGAVVVFWRGKQDDGTTGHVGVIDSVDGDYLNVIGGNQRDCICVARFHTSRVLGYRWPRAVSRTKGVAGGVLAVAGGTAATGATVVEALAPEPSAVAKTADMLAAAKGPVEQMAAATQGMAVYKWFAIAGAVLAVGGAVLAIYGRHDVREKTGY